MKKKIIIGAIISAIVLSLSTFAVYSINKSNNYTPSEAINRYYEAAKNGDLEEAEKYIATEVLDFYETSANGITGTLSYAITEEGNQYSEVNPLAENINGETANVTVEVTYKGPENKNIEQFLLIKENDGWKLTFQ